MKIFFLALVTLVTILATGQDRKLNIGVQAFPNFSTATPSAETASTEYYKGPETFTFSYSTGLQLDWNFADKWTLSGGLLYKVVGEKGKTIPPDPNRGFLYPMQYGFKFSYIELQINFLRKIRENWIVELGCSPAYLLSAKFGISRDQYFMVLGEAYRNSFALNANLGLGFRTKISGANLKILPYAQLDLFESIHEFFPSHGFPSMRFIALGLRTVFTI